MKPCLKLRQRCLECDYTGAELAKRIHRCPAYVSGILAARTPADASDIYAIAQALRIPPEEWADYFFPPEVCSMLDHRVKNR